MLEIPIHKLMERLSSITVAKLTAQYVGIFFLVYLYPTVDKQFQGA